MKKTVRTGERWLPHVHNVTGIEHLHRYAMACELAQQKTVLDIACGEGYGSRLLAQHAKDVTGVDIDQPSIEEATKKYAGDNIRFIQADVRKTALPDHTYDLVVSFETLEHIAEHETFLHEIKRLLKPGGRLIISTPDKKEYSDKPNYRNPFHIKELYRQEFEALIAGFFAHYQIFQQRSSHSSTIMSTNLDRYEQYSGDHTHLSKNSNDGWVYLIAIASDNELPALNNSIFNGQHVFQSALEEYSNDLKNTITYKVGHFILWPVKWFYKIIAKRK